MKLENQSGLVKGRNCPRWFGARPRRPLRSPAWALCSLWTVLLVLASCWPLGSVRARGLPAREGIGNFGKVNEHLYRGAQPGPTGMARLKQLGVKLIVNLRMPGDGWKDEAAQAQANGIAYTNFPMSGATRPNDQQVRQILALFESFAQPIFVHCQFGCDRTGMIVACYRIHHDHWSGESAMQEAKGYGISRWEFPLKRYISDFARASKPGVYSDLQEARAK